MKCTFLLGAVSFSSVFVGVPYMIWIPTICQLEAFSLYFHFILFMMSFDGHTFLKIALLKYNLYTIKVTHIKGIIHRVCNHTTI